MSKTYSRDLRGYGATPPDPCWPNGARLALQIVVNYEEGGENCVLHGDTASEAFLSEIVNADAREGVRHMSMESVYEFGSRVGVWRLKKLFDRYKVPVTVFAVGMAVERYPEPVQALHAAGHEICSHGYRWIDYQYVDEATERAHMQKAIRAIEDATGERPLGWYTGRTSPNTRSLVVEEGGFIYDADDYSDELPFWNRQHGQPHLRCPFPTKPVDGADHGGDQHGGTWDRHRAGAGRRRTRGPARDRYPTRGRAPDRSATDRT